MSLTTSKEGEAIGMYVIINTHFHRPQANRVASGMWHRLIEARPLLCETCVQSIRIARVLRLASWSFDSEAFGSRTCERAHDVRAFALRKQPQAFVQVDCRSLMTSTLACHRRPGLIVLKTWNQAVVFG